MTRGSNLSNVNWDSERHNANANTACNAPRNEQREALGKVDEEKAKDKGQRGDADGPRAAESIGDDTTAQRAHHRPHIHNGAKERVLICVEAQTVVAVFERIAHRRGVPHRVPKGEGPKSSDESKEHGPFERGGLLAVGLDQEWLLLRHVFFCCVGRCKQREKCARFKMEESSPVAGKEKEVFEALAGNSGSDDDQEEELDAVWLAGVSGESSREDVLKGWLLAAQFGVVSEAERLEPLALHAGFTIDAHDEDGYTALHRAAYGGHEAMLDWLLSRGASMGARTRDGWEPLHSAAFWNQPQAVQRLLTNGADANARTGSGQTALHLAASKASTGDAAVILLLHAATDATQRNDMGETAADLAARHTAWASLFALTDACLR
eukprot:m.229222 g.229222  ORF g.229222 m.229222 type:complete len:380 (-) comp17699_c0_seq1:406-1545(-)